MGAVRTLSKADLTTACSGATGFSWASGDEDSSSVGRMLASTKLKCGMVRNSLIVLRSRRHTQR
jgi:hypothetical protein